MKYTEKDWLITEEEAQEFNAIFHKLWTQAGSERYDKKDWKRLRELLVKLKVYV